MASIVHFIAETFPRTAAVPAKDALKTSWTRLGTVGAPPTMEASTTPKNEVATIGIQASAKLTIYLALFVVGWITTLLATVATISTGAQTVAIHWMIHPTIFTNIGAVPTSWTVLTCCASEEKT